MKQRWSFLVFPLCPLCTLCLALVAVSGCAHPKAAALPSPPLDVPGAPPRDLEVRDVEPPAPEPPPVAPEPARPAPPPARPRPQPSRETPKPETPSEPRPEEPSRPPGTLQTAPTAADAQLERDIRTTLARAHADLRRVDPRKLTADVRDQYDTATRFVRQAEDAIQAKNLVFARTLADKAAALASQLAVR